MFEDEPEDEGKECPTPESVLEKIMEKRKRKPKMFPGDPYQAAKFWMAHQEQPKDYTENAEPITKNGKITGWKTPYHDRLAVNLRLFFRLKHIHQLHVIENVEAGVAWRGDPPNIYIEVVKQAMKMRADPGRYVDQAIEALHGFNLKERPEQEA